MTAPGGARPSAARNNAVQTNNAEHLARFTAVTRRLARLLEHMRALALTLPEQTWNASEMRRRDWIAAERAFNRREPLSKECDMGQGR